MLRVGLTGNLGSGKSTVAGFLRELGAEVIEADALGRELMEPGQPVFAEIVRVFGPQAVASDGNLNRVFLGTMAFQQGRLQELNAIVHPAVIAAEERWMEEVFERDPDAIAVVESALIFEVERDARQRGETQGPMADWRNRMDRVVVITASEDAKIARYAARVGGQNATGPALAAIQAEARLRLSHQIPDEEKAARADYLLKNDGDIAGLRAQVEALWQQLKAERN
jgi:dephospho-CoA kinase